MLSKKSLTVEKHNQFFKIAGLMIFLIGSIGCAALNSRTPKNLVDAGRLQEAKASGMSVAMEDKGGRPAHWKEQLDAGDDPLNPGCACRYEQPGCGGAIVGRAVDECWPPDGVSLNEKTVPTTCSTYSDKQYDCEKLLGPGAKCQLIELTCCGVKTTSAFCVNNGIEAVSKSPKGVVNDKKRSQ